MAKILIIGGSGSGKTNALLNLINNQPDIDKIYLYAKDPYEAKHQHLINKREKVGLAHPATRRRGDVVTTSLCTSPRRLKQVSNETPNDVSVVRHQDVSVARIHNVPLVQLYDVSCNSQMKHPITSLWYASTTSRSQVVATPCLYYGLSYVFKLFGHDLHMVGFHVSFKYQIKRQIFLVQPGRKQEE